MPDSTDCVQMSDESNHLMQMIQIMMSLVQTTYFYSATLSLGGDKFIFKLPTFFISCLATAIHNFKYRYLKGNFLNLSENVNFSNLKGQLQNTKIAMLFNFNSHPLEAVSRYRDPQLQVGENYLHLSNWGTNIWKWWCSNTYFIPNDSDSMG